MSGILILISVVVLSVLIMGMRLDIEVPQEGHNDHSNVLNELDDLRDFPLRKTK